MVRRTARSQPATVGRYCLHQAIAAGGCATVHLGQLRGAAGFSRLVAVKRLHAAYASDDALAAMFVDEARLTSRLHHPNIVSTLDVVAEDGELFLVLEYVHGVSLASLIRTLRGRQDALPAEVAITIVAGALHGLHAAHVAIDERGEPLRIVHRDVSPQNILVGADGVPKIADFGVAKAVGRAQNTTEGQIKGKIGYMAPEQLRSGEVDKRSDVFAASVVLWEALTGERMYGTRDAAGIVGEVLFSKPRPPGQLVDGLPHGLDAAVLRGLAKDPGDRYATAEEMALALEDLVTPLGRHDLGAWVQSIAASELEERARAISEMEGDFSGVRATRSTPAPPTRGARVDGSEADTTPEGDHGAHALVDETTLSRSTTTSGPRALPRRSRATPALAALAICGLGAWLWSSRNGETRLPVAAHARLGPVVITRASQVAASTGDPPAEATPEATPAAVAASAGAAPATGPAPRRPAAQARPRTAPRAAGEPNPFHFPSMKRE
jgi:serine/threonine-protein kinase